MPSQPFALYTGLSCTVSIAYYGKVKVLGVLFAIPLNKKSFSCASLTYVSIKRLYVSECTCSIIDWKE